MKTDRMFGKKKGQARKVNATHFTRGSHFSPILVIDLGRFNEEMPPRRTERRPHANVDMSNHRRNDVAPLADAGKQRVARLYAATLGTLIVTPASLKKDEKKKGSRSRKKASDKATAFRSGTNVFAATPAIDRILTIWTHS